MFKLRFNWAWVANKLLDEVIMELLESEKGYIRWFLLHLIK